MKCKKKRFRPSKISRYLKQSVSPDIWKTDLKEYNSHRFRVFAAQPKTNTSPPPMNPYNYVNVRKLLADANRLKQIDEENKMLLKHINTINRTTGWVDTYNANAYQCKSNWIAHVRKMKKIDEKNKCIYTELKNVKSGYSRDVLLQSWQQMLTKLELSSKFPLVILEKTSTDELLLSQPSISLGLEKFCERPQCFIEFKVLNGVHLGRIDIELYTDHVPVTCQNFLSICTGKNKKNLTYENCVVHRIVSGKFLESGDIVSGTGRNGNSIYGTSFAEEGHNLKHTKAGVISMIRSCPKCENDSRFCITFACMHSLDHQNVVFGRVVRGADNLLKLEGYGRKIGRPLAPIIISKCGKIEAKCKF